MSNDVMLLLGEIRGELKGVNERLDSQSTAITKLSTDVCDLKVAGARHGTVAGIVSSVGVMLIAESIKAFGSGHGGA